MLRSLSITFTVAVNNHPTTLLFGRCAIFVDVLDGTVAWNIEAMSLKMGMWLWIDDTFIHLIENGIGIGGI